LSSSSTSRPTSARSRPLLRLFTMSRPSSSTPSSGRRFCEYMDPRAYQLTHFQAPMAPRRLSPVLLLTSMLLTSPPPSSPLCKRVLRWLVYGSTALEEYIMAHDAFRSSFRIGLGHGHCFRWNTRQAKSDEQSSILKRYTALTPLLRRSILHFESLF
jgi:hypothetical protein